MNLLIILLKMFLLFLVIYFAVRLAIKPLITNEHEPKIENGSNNYSLSTLRKIDVLSNREYEEVLNIYAGKNVKIKIHEDKRQKEYLRYFKVLNELKEIGYFSSEMFEKKVSMLKKYYKEM